MKTYDVFISYAIEDKAVVASSIANGLKKRGLKVYYAGDELGLGDSVSETIYTGLEESEYCIIILSRHYVRNWPAIERNHILRREKKERRTLIFPIWHGISMDDVKNNFPELIDHYAESTQIGVNDIIDNLYRALGKKRKAYRRKRRNQLIAISLVMAAIITFSAYKIKSVSIKPLTNTEISNFVKKRIDTYQLDLENEFKQKMRKYNGHRIGLETLFSNHTNFGRKAKHENNEYVFNNGRETITDKKKIEDLGFVAFESPDSKYGLVWPDVYELNMTSTTEVERYSFIVKEPRQTTFKIDSKKRHLKKMSVWVSYTHPLRVVYGDLGFTYKGSKETQKVTMYGFKEKEEYIFEYIENHWMLKDVN
jgi:hypothetical protein